MGIWLGTKVRYAVCQLHRPQPGKFEKLLLLFTVLTTEVLLLQERVSLQPHGLEVSLTPPKKSFKLSFLVYVSLFFRDHREE